MSDIIRRLEQRDSVKKILEELGKLDDVTDVAVALRMEDGTLSVRWAGDSLRLITACHILANDMQVEFLSGKEES